MGNGKMKTKGEERARSFVLNDADIIENDLPQANSSGVEVCGSSRNK